MVSIVFCFFFIDMGDVTWTYDGMHVIKVDIFN